MDKRLADICGDYSGERYRQLLYCVCVRYIRKAALETPAILSETEFSRVLNRAMGIRSTLRNTWIRAQYAPWFLPRVQGVSCIIINRISQLSPHVLIQSMRTSFCIYRLEIRHNTGYNYQIWAIGAGNELSGVILPDGGFHTLALFSLLMTAFGGRIRDLSWNAPYFGR